VKLDGFAVPVGAVKLTLMYPLAGTLVADPDKLRTTCPFVVVMVGVDPLPIVDWTVPAEFTVAIETVMVPLLAASAHKSTTHVPAAMLLAEANWVE